MLTLRYAIKRKAMKSLNLNWFFENQPDFEYKKYLLLAYLQHVHHQFNQTKLYPALADLVAHYRNLKQFKKSKDELYEVFPNQIDQLDLQQFKISFSKVISNDELMNHLEEIIDFSLPVIQKHIDEGKEIYDFVEKEIVLAPVGILPIYRNEGYLLVKQQDIRVYEYAVKLFVHEDIDYRAINATYITAYEHNFVNTCENIKIDMIRNRKKLPNPATFFVETRFDYPIEDTLLPITKRLLIKYLA
ncbi:MAG: hypothetical protein EAY81_01775 [Bacteroidetes bacterium]|nr:MAG: hypothetical protein EAY81_01775 [Bacteroidota bacterium]